MVEASGAKMLSVHCRTKVQAYKGNADWTWLEKIKNVLSIPLVGNGDIICGADAREMFECGCDGVMIGRGALSNPWIFEQIKNYLKTENESPLPSVGDRVALCIEHLNHFVSFYGEGQGVYSFRKYFSGYFRNIAYVSKLRCDLMCCLDSGSIIERLEQFLREWEDFSSV